MVWPIYLNLFGLLRDIDMDDITSQFTAISNMKRLGREYMSKNKDDFVTTFYHKAMTFLNPTMKKLTMIKPSERKAIHREIDDYIASHYTDRKVS